MSVDAEKIAQKLAKLFISRTDVKAEQQADGSYRPVREKWCKNDLLAHLAGDKTYGHYLLGSDNQVKLFSFDIDLATDGFWDEHKNMTDQPEAASYQDMVVRHDNVNPRELFADWRSPSRQFYKNQMRFLADMLTEAIRSELDVPAIAAFSGNKGIHVYGLTGPLPAREAREAGRIVLDRFDGLFLPARGGTFYRSPRDADPAGDFSNFTVELFPKNDELTEDGLGNLMRLPLGKNRKQPKAPCFFLDTRAEAELMLAPHPDAVAVLEQLTNDATPRTH